MGGGGGDFQGHHEIKGKIIRLVLYFGEFFNLELKFKKNGKLLRTLSIDAHHS